MAMRPLEKLPSIRAKLGSVIVFAVGMTVLLVYVFLGFALRGASRNSDLVELLKLADRLAASEPVQAPKGATFALLKDGLFTWAQPPEGIGMFTDGRVHVGTYKGVAFAAVPAPALGAGASVYAYRKAPAEGVAGILPATVRFLRDFWWQLLVAGAIASALALVVARWLARGLTQPLRDMAAATRRMEVGDYSVRVHSDSRDEVGQLAAAFNRMSGELESLERLRRDLVANVSHELKTPITAIRAHLENLADGVETPNTETMQIMLTQTERLGRLVEQLLDLSRLESGEIPLRRERVSVGPLVAQVVSEIDVARSGQGVAINPVIAEDVPALDADPERVHQVLFNLVDNAVRFTPGGGTVTISAHRHNGSVEITVADTGVGIASEHIPRLFERFYRVDPARSREDGGTGIGLAIARSVVEAHGGHIRAHSAPGEGSAFTFDLPAAGADHDGRRSDP
jgi:signal transduction histidine kinase